MKKATGDSASSSCGTTAGGGQSARILTVLAINLGLGLAAVVFASSNNGRLPDLNARTLAIGLLPASAAMGLVLACRRLDLSLPVLLVLVLNLDARCTALPQTPFLRLATLCGIAGAVGLLNAFITWHARISSALWTGLVGFGLWLTMAALGMSRAGPGAWPWPWVLGASLGLVAAGAAVLGITGMVGPPSLPPILRAGWEGFAGLAGSWILAGAAVAMASRSDALSVQPEELRAAYPRMLAAAALGGAYILRGRWAPLAAVASTCAGHLVWSFAWNTDLGNPLADVLVPAAAPLAAIPLYLAIDWTIRRSTGESPPTGLLA